VHADVIQPNCIAQGFIKPHGVGIKEMYLAFTGHVVDVSGFEEEFSGIHIFPLSLVGWVAKPSMLHLRKLMLGFVPQPSLPD
jgi:hypothetical protein